MLFQVLLTLMLFVITTSDVRAQPAKPATGFQPNVKVTAPTRIDWVYALASQSPAAPPADWLPNYDSTEQSYELFVPAGASAKKMQPLVLFISPSDDPAGFQQFGETCRRLGMILAAPRGAGNNCETRQRVRIVLDVLDDVRRHYAVDPDRTYIAGFSGGGRIACAIAYSLPEYFGGVLPICAAGELREETWLRHRVIERLSVAHLTGETDFNRGEVERLRNPMLAAVGVRSRAWVVPKLGHGVPDGKTLGEALAWLEEAAPARGQLARRYPASRAAAGDDAKMFAREQLAQQLLSEAKKRVAIPKSRYSGLMQMKGVLERWPDLPAAEDAKRVLLTYEQGADRAWEQADIAEQRLFLIARARALDAYASGDLPQQYAAERASMAAAARELWQLVIDDGQDAQAVAEAQRRLPELAKIASEGK